MHDFGSRILASGKAPLNLARANFLGNFGPVLSTIRTMCHQRELGLRAHDPGRKKALTRFDRAFARAVSPQERTLGMMEELRSNVWRPFQFAAERTNKVTSFSPARTAPDCSPLAGRDNKRESRRERRTWPPYSLELHPTNGRWRCGAAAASSVAHRFGRRSEMTWASGMPKLLDTGHRQMVRIYQQDRLATTTPKSGELSCRRTSAQ